MKQSKTSKIKGYKEKLSGHKNAVLKIVSPYGINGNILISGCKDGILRVWDLTNQKSANKIAITRPKEEQLMAVLPVEEDTEEHEEETKSEKIEMKIYKNSLKKEEVSCLDFGEKTCYIGFNDGLLTAFNIISGELMMAFKGHQFRVNDVYILHQTAIASCSLDGTIRIWNSMTGFCEKVYRFNGDVSRMMVDGNAIYAIVDKVYLVSFSYDKTDCLNSTLLKNGYVTCACLLNPGQIIIATSQKLLEVYELPQPPGSPGDLKLKHSITGLNSFCTSLLVHDNLVFGGGDDAVIYVWNLSLKGPQFLVDEMHGHNGGIITLALCDESLFSGSLDQSVRSWDLKEMEKRIQERALMYKEDIRSKKWEEAWKVLGKYRKKKGGKK